MYTMLLGVLLAIVVTAVFTVKRAPCEIRIDIPFLIILCGIYIGLFAPLSGYEEYRQVHEYRLVYFEDGSLVKVNNNEYSYLYEGKKVFRKDRTEPFVKILSKTVHCTTRTNITLDENINCTAPTLIVSESKQKSSNWTFAFGNPKSIYCFFVPTGSIDTD